MAIGDIWMTIEETPRKLVELGVSALDSDCIVASVQGEDRTVWLVESLRADWPVIGLNNRRDDEIPRAIRIPLS